ncbi:MAG: glucose 1-dehydrogenase [Acidobacteriaceae bacterium]|nr:glucose 1-dehydrogenase [Acidobacteriaceae bacterium]
MRLQNNVAIVTGSSSGIGQDIAIRLAAEGAAVVINYSGNAEGAEATQSQIEQAGGRAFVVRADLAKVSDTQHLIEETWAHFGGCDILVNNAGVEKSADFWDVTEDDYDKVLDVNLKGVFFTTQAFVRRLRDAKRPGRIINISSVHEDMAFPHFSTYCASKGGLRMLTRNLAVELGPLNITINNIAPGAIVTPINRSLLADKPKLDALLRNIPLNRLGATDDVAALAAFLASDEAGYITGSTYVVDGGLMVNYHEQ